MRAHDDIDKKVERIESAKKSGKRFVPSMEDVYWAISAEWPGLIGRNLFFGDRLEKRGELALSFDGLDVLDPGPWSDKDTVAVRRFLENVRPEWRVSTALADDALSEVGRIGAFNPVLEYFQGLKWDGQARLDGWLIAYLGADDTDYHMLVGPRWLIGAAARAYRPGCKMDCVLVLEGPQGVGKSTALAVLGGEWFSDSPGDLMSKEAGHSIQGYLLIELPELEGMRKADTQRLKQFFSVRVDQYRPPYGRYFVEVPRRCVFAATTNEGAYLRDETGHRRFWPVRCGDIDIEALERDRDQLWAEAVHRMRAGESWTVPQEAAATFAEEARQREVEDPWAEAVLAAARELAVPQTGRILEKMDISVERRDRRAAARVSAILTAEGWTYKPVRISGKLVKQWVEG